MDSYQSESVQDRDTTESNKVKKIVSPGNVLDEYVELLDKHESQLISKYGEPDLIDTLYGGLIYYYKDRSVAFGLDGSMISSIFLYKGQLNENIKIGSSIDEILQSLNLTKKSVQSSPEFEKSILYDYKDHESYLIFYDELLQEILIKE